MLNHHKISQSEIDHFDQFGYLIVRKALDEEMVQRLIRSGDHLLKSDLQQNRQTSVGGLYDGFRNAITLDDVFIPLIDHPTILPTVVQLLGADLHIMTSHLIHKQPDPSDKPLTYRQPGWHRDYAMATHDLGNAAIPRMLVKCAYYLTDLTEPHRGATMVAPGSNHLLGRPVIAEGQSDPDGAVEPSLQPGDCLIFENRTFHAGAVHRGSETRKAIMVGYGYRWVRPMDYVHQPPSFLEKLTPLQRYLVGEPFEHVDTFQVDGGRNPLKEWCALHGIPLARHPKPQSI
ncbi:MAG: phytanoyl-CoA dioxygenase family protein [bacterium]|nr:phytanoyl-CoA dioxygenase family protein [bacterium]